MSDGRDLHPGDIVRYRSPLLGETFTGTVSHHTGDSVTIEHHAPGHQDCCTLRPGHQQMTAYTYGSRTFEVLRRSTRP